MKILSVDPSIPDNGADSWRISNIAKILESNGHEIHFVHYCRRAYYKKLENTKKPLNYSLILASPITLHIKHLKVLFDDQYDLVYGNTHSGAFYSMLGKLKGIPLIFDMHGGLVEEFMLMQQSNSGWWHSQALGDYFLRMFINLVDLRFSDKILCVSNKMIKYLHEKNKIPLDRMAYVTNGVDLDFLRPINVEKIKNMKIELGIENKLVFGYIGGFHKWQGVEQFIEAAKKFNGKNLAFLIVGGRIETKEDNIIFIPKIPHAKVPDYYSICDVLVLPRPSHPATEMAAPTKFAEYAAMGKPILTTKVGDAAEFVTKYKCGIVVKDNEIENLIKGINEFRNKSNKELEIMGSNSRALAENEFDWIKIGIKLLETVEST